MKLASVSLLVSLIATVSALLLPFERRSVATAPTRLQKRADNPANASDAFHFENLSDLIYVGNITVDGQVFEVQLDTGSSDLWIDSTGILFQSARSTGVDGQIQYLDTSEASGPILVTAVTFGNWTSSNQAFISAVGTNATSFGDKGLLGVGPPSLSTIAESLKGSQFNGNSFLDNVFDANPNDPNMITFLLSRSEVSGRTDGGDFTIGTVASGYEKILSTTKFPVISDSTWETAINGIIVDGTSYSGNSMYLQGDKISALLDTGTSLGIAIKPYVDAMYSNIPGAQWSEADSTYLFPCESIVNVSMVFGDEIIFIHPIDLAIPYQAKTDGSSAMCAGAFQVDDQAGVDFLLGDSFLRNVYSLFFFGQWTNSGTGTPYMQVLGITDPNQACSEFASLNAQRIQDFVKQDSSSVSSSNSSGSSDSVSGAVSDSSSFSPTVDLSTLTRNSFIIMGMVGLAVFLLLVNIGMAVRKNRGYRQIGAPGSAPPPHFADRPYSTPYDG